jgi:hypothetical protein
MFSGGDFDNTALCILFEFGSASLLCVLQQAQVSLRAVPIGIQCLSGYVIIRSGIIDHWAH